eukprot:1670760-Alexandrium_andersonii.AAC.1
MGGRQGDAEFTSRASVLVVLGRCRPESELAVIGQRRFRPSLPLRVAEDARMVIGGPGDERK